MVARVELGLNASDREKVTRSFEMKNKDKRYDSPSLSLTLVIYYFSKRVLPQT